MLFDILLVVLVIYVMAVPFLMLKFIKFGMLAVEKPEETAKEPTFKVKFPENFTKLPKLRRKPKLTKEERKALEAVKILERNIDAYDGTGVGQEEIKHGFN